MKRILVVSDLPPISSDRAGSPRLYEFSKSLKHHFELDLISITNDHASEEYKVFNDFTLAPRELKNENFLDSLFRHITLLPSFYMGFSNRAELLKIKKLIAQKFSEKKYELIYVNGLSSFQYIPKNLTKFVYLDLCDSVSKLKYREAKLEKDSIKKLLLFEESFAIFIKEVQAIRDVKKVSFISESETANLDFLFKTARYSEKLLILGNGIEADFFPYKAIDDLSKKILFFGALDYLPNHDAAVWFLDEVFPLIQQKFPQLEFHVVGRNPSPELIEMFDNKNSFIHADVPEMYPYVESSRIVVVPLRIGAGVKNKILLTALAGRPIISTAVGIEGLEGFLQKVIYEANNPREYVEKISQLLEIGTPQLDQILKAASVEVQRKYDWKNSASQIVSMVNS